MSTVLMTLLEVVVIYFIISAVASRGDFLTPIVVLIISRWVWHTTFIQFLRDSGLIFPAADSFVDKFLVAGFLTILTAIPYITLFPVFVELRTRTRPVRALSIAGAVLFLRFAILPFLGFDLWFMEPTEAIRLNLV